jgi:hypothetical protein
MGIGEVFRLKEVNGLPVDYPLRFSGPVTASPPAASGMASHPARSKNRGVSEVQCRGT